MQKKPRGRGYYNLDLTGFFVALVLFGAVLGIGAYALAQWLWPIAKAWLHAVTA